MSVDEHRDGGTDKYSNSRVAVRHKPKISPSFCTPYFKCYAVSGVPGSVGIPCKELDDNFEAEYRFSQEDYRNGLKPGDYTTIYRAEINPDVALCPK